MRFFIDGKEVGFGEYYDDLTTYHDDDATELIMTTDINKPNAIARIMLKKGIPFRVYLLLIDSEKEKVHEERKVL